MKILILNASLNNDDDLGAYLSKLEEKITQKCISVKHLLLSKKTIHFCTGCWQCWVKSPGICAIKDDMEEIYFSFIEADLVIFATPLILGYENSQMKKVKDRLIPLLHCYIELVNGECHHRKRYAQYPAIAYIIKKERNTDTLDMKIFEKIQRRFALNFRSNFVGLYNINTTISELCLELNKYLNTNSILR